MGSDTTHTDRLERTNKRLQLATATVGLMAAIATCLGVVLTLTAKKANEATTKVDTSQQQIQTLQAENKTLRDRFSVAEATIAELKQNGSPSLKPSGATSDSGGLIYHHDPVSVVAGAWGIDLDAPPDDHSWTKPGGTEVELSWGKGGPMTIGTWSGGDVLMAGAATYEACDHASGFNHDNISLTELQRYSFICFKTSEDRLSLVAVKAASADQLKLDVTTYAKAGD